MLAPGGVASFQFIDGHDKSLRGRLYGILPTRWLNLLRRIAWRRSAVFEMHCLEEAHLHALLQTRSDIQLLASYDDGAAGLGWRGRRWILAMDVESPRRIERDGYVLYAYDSDLHIGAPLIAGHAHEPHVERAMRERLRKGDVMLDIGANVGSLALLAAALVGTAGRVIAVEPLARNRQHLRHIKEQTNGAAKCVDRCHHGYRFECHLILQLPAEHGCRRGDGAISARKAQRSLMAIRLITHRRFKSNQEIRRCPQFP